LKDPSLNNHYSLKFDKITPLIMKKRKKERGQTERSKKKRRQKIPKKTSSLLRFNDPFPPVFLRSLELKKIFAVWLSELDEVQGLQESNGLANASTQLEENDKYELYLIHPQVTKRKNYF
jgi:hypothetical protein